MKEGAADYAEWFENGFIGSRCSGCYDDDDLEEAFNAGAEGKAELIKTLSTAL